MTEEKIKSLGFEKVKTYEHGDFETNRYTKGSILAEFTYLKGSREVHTFDISLEEITVLEVNFTDLQTLDRIIN